MKLNSKRSKTNLEGGLCDQNDPVSFRLLPGFIPEIARFDSDLFFHC